jgi:tetratricopeptide (TPR) repeat protein
MPTARKLPVHEPEERLESWKEIAAYLNCSERTAKRWEKTRQLPVRRLPGASGGVFANRLEVAVWRSGDGLLPEPAAEGGPKAPDVSTPGVQGRAAGQATWWPRWIAAAVILGVSVGGAVHAFHSRRPMTAKPAGHVAPREAQDLYLRGRFYWNKRTASDLERAMSDFQAAATLDPSYAQPYAGMADVYALEPQFGTTPPATAFPRMLELARRALALDPDLPEGHRALAFGLLYWDWDRAASQREFERAIELNPRDATTLHWYANALQQTQNVAAAMPLIDKARELEPTDRSILSDRATILADLGHMAEANEAWDTIEASEPTYLPPHLHRSGFAEFQRQSDLYLGELKAIAAITHSPDDLRRWRTGIEAYRRGGWKALLNAEADLNAEFARQHGAGYFYTALSLDEASRDKEALEFVELAYQRRDFAFLLLPDPSHFSGLAGNARFEALKSQSLKPYPEGGVVPTKDGN